MSEAEERIRGKAEAALRQEFPTGRIIHELVLFQGGVRIDLAVVTPERLVVCEVKSERDVLTRLEAQVKAANDAADAMLVTVAAKHLEKAQKVAGYLNCCDEDEVVATIQRTIHRRALEGTCNSPARLSMLWANELRQIAGVGSKPTRSYAIRYISDSMNGSQVRRAVCAALRARHFPRADAPILSEMFPVVTRPVL